MRFTCINYVTYLLVLIRDYESYPQQYFLLNKSTLLLWKYNYTKNELTRSCITAQYIPNFEKVIFQDKFKLHRYLVQNIMYTSQRQGSSNSAKVVSL